MIPNFGAEADKAIQEACAQFPERFGLRNHEGVFRVSERASYVSRGQVLVYTQKWRGSEWVDFAKGTIAELKAQVVRPII